MKAETTKPELVAALEQLAQREDRATLAMLRASLRSERSLEALRFVLPFVRPGLSDGRRIREEDDAMLVAGLFALHPQSGPKSLAQVLAAMGRQSKNDSIEGRFRAMLNAERDGLPVHLKHVILLVASKGLPISWADLWWTLRGWSEPVFTDVPVPRLGARGRWATDFWSYGGENERSADEGSDAQT
jgi:CRISPR system Cascade subunit CasB